MAESGLSSRYWSSTLILGVGLAVAAYSYATLRLGSIQRPGPGAFPLVLGVFLIGTGAISILTIAWKNLAGTAAPAAVVRTGDEEAEHLDWKVALAVIVALIVFALLVESVGLAPAIFCQIMITASIGNKLSWRARFLLAACSAVAAALIFSVMLSVPVKIFNWPFGG